MEPLDLALVRTFILVADGGSFTGAAGPAQRTQPTVSRQVRALEAALGVPLFVRAGRSARLTSAGRRFLDYARRLVALAEEARTAVADEGRLAACRLRVGAGGVPSQYLLPPLLEALRARQPAAHPVVAAHHPETVAAMVARGDLDVGLVTRPVRAPGLTLEDAGEDEQVAIAAPEHPWARRSARALPLEAFDGQPFILYDRGTGTSRRILGLFARQGVRLEVSMEVGYIEAMKAMVRIGLGVSLVPAWVVAREVAEGTLLGIPVAGPTLRRRWALAYLRGRVGEAPLADFLAVCRGALPGLLAGSRRRRGR